MVKTCACTVIAVTAALLGSLAAAAEQPHGAANVLVVRVYDGSSGHARNRTTAILTAASIAAEAGLDIHWTDCTRTAQVGACTDLRGPRDLIVRIMPVSAAGSPGLLIRDQSRRPLGFSVVDPVVGAGAIAVVFLDRVVPLARRTGVDSGRLLGRAIAHEIGHLLLGTNEHSRTGLMREVWTDEELARDTPRDWLFSDSDRLRQQLR